MILHIIFLLHSNTIFAVDATLCSHLTFDHTVQKCCQGKLSPIPYGTPGCCQTTAFNKDNYMCCNGNVTPRPNTDNVACCGGLGYNINIEICCKAKVFYKRYKNSGCCDDQVYDKSTALCCNGIVRSVMHLQNRYWDNWQDALMRNKSMKHLSCCRTKVYNKQTHNCCRGRIITKDPDCDEMSWNIEEEICCKGVIHLKRSEYTECCGSRTYIPPMLSRNMFCCDEVLHLANELSYFDYEKFACCGSEFHEFRRLSSKCCNGRYVYASHYDRQCCGDYYYRDKNSPQTFLTGLCCDSGRSDVIFSYTNGVCFGGRSYFHKHMIDYEAYSPPPAAAFFCGEDFYDISTHICCNGTMHELGYGSQDCCGNRVYNPQKQKCCEGTVYDLWIGSGYYVHDAQCCGSSLYNEKNVVCCNGVVHVKPQGCSWVCCGKEIYPLQEGQKKVCCEEKAFDYVEGFDCCGQDYYKKGSMLSCCNANLFNSSSHVCCSGEVNLIKGSVAKCCGSNSFNNATEICCEANKVQPKRGSHVSCCGTQSYDKLTAVCCGNVVYTNPPTFPKCCGKKVFDFTKEICCENVVNSLEGNSTHCCRQRAYNPLTQECCENNIVSKELSCCYGKAYNASTYICCGEALYNKSDFICCDGTLNHRKSKNDECCGEKYAYDPISEGCCGNLPYPRIGPKGQLHECCYGKYLYDTNKHCCDVYSGMVLNVKAAKCCITGASSTYDFVNELCCKGVIFPATTNATCCGMIVINSFTHKCCSKGTPADLVTAEAQCCGDYATYDPDTQECCNGNQVIPKPTSSEQLCGCARYSPSSDLCCPDDNEVSGYKIISLSEGDTCCYGKAYFRETEKCCNDNFIDTRTPVIAKAGLECCSLDMYRWYVPSYFGKDFVPETLDPNSQICCMGKIIDNPTGELRCCPGDDILYFMSSNVPVYNVTYQKCCDDLPVNIEDLCCKTKSGILTVYPNPSKMNLACCQSDTIGWEKQKNRVYNQDTEECIRGSVHEKHSDIVDC